MTTRLVAGSKPRFLVYTCVTGGYDTVLPPVEASSNADFLVLTDVPDTSVEGWRVKSIDREFLAQGSLANRYHKLLPHRIFPDYDISLYIDGNIRVLRDLSPLFHHFATSGRDIGIFRHPERRTVRAEVRACIRKRKCSDPAGIIAEYERYLARGFPDDRELSENCMILRNHQSRRMALAGDLWWRLVRRFSGRDQISLPYVRWSLGLSEILYPFHAREPNPYFAAYPHNGVSLLRRLVARAQGKRHDNVAYESISRALDVVARVRRS